MSSRAIPAVGLALLLVGIGVAVMVDRSDAGPTDAAPTTTMSIAASSTATTTPAVDPPPPTGPPAGQPTAGDPSTETSGLPDRGVHPPLVQIDGWLQSDVTSLEELRGNVVAVQFWTFACRNCKATLPHIQQLYDDYRDQGFEIVGVHAPEFDFEADADNVVEAAAELGVTWPIALDTAKQTFHSWQEGPRAFWPRIYLLDRDGHIRYDHIGEGRYDEIDAAVAALLAEPTGT